jgi:hypothetical protein
LDDLPPDIECVMSIVSKKIRMSNTAPKHGTVRAPQIHTR